MTDEQKQQIALFRYGLIAPIVMKKISKPEKYSICKKILSQKYDIPCSKRDTINERTLRRYIAAFHNGGFNALLPGIRSDKGRLRCIDEKLQNKLLTLRSKNRELKCRKFYSNLIESGNISTTQISYTTFNRFLYKHDVFKSVVQKDSFICLMQKIMNSKNSIEDYREQIKIFIDFDKLKVYLYKGKLKERKKAMLVFSYYYGIPKLVICDFLDISIKTFGRYLKTLQTKGLDALFEKPSRRDNKFDNEEIKIKVFSVLHRPPSDFGFNRTTWKLFDLKSALRTEGCSVSRAVISKIVKNAGFKWRKAKVVLTSPDPEYKQKLESIQSILSNLKSNELFFSIDEYGPFAIKQIGGKMLLSPDQDNIIPQWQKSKGSLIITAALELSTNIITHFYSNKKNTNEMIKMMDILLEKYKEYKKIYLSWDAASWHISKKLSQHIEENNTNALVSGGCIVETAPLPSSAQFLNIIESVFSGMARAIIHNSDYESDTVAKIAIDRYFNERNKYFKENPKRAGQKIWGKERALCEFSEGSNCKDPKYR